MGLLITSLIVIGLVGAFFGSAYFIADAIDDMYNDEKFFTPITYASGPILEAPTPEEIERVKNYLKSDVDEYKPNLNFENIPGFPKFNLEDIPGFNPKPLPMPDDKPIYDLDSILKVNSDIIRELNPDIIPKVNPNIIPKLNPNQ